MNAWVFEEAAEHERLLIELGRFTPETAGDAGLHSLGYRSDRGWFAGRRAA
ncbi:hypothetical protein ACWDR0_10275 [Streptomyces sp. NPDC003691]